MGAATRETIEPATLDAVREAAIPLAAERTTRCWH